jgi:hypothetical protein
MVVGAVREFAEVVSEADLGKLFFLTSMVEAA